MKPHPAVTGRRARAKQDKRNRILSAASVLLAERDIGRVTMQEIADLADVAIGTLYLYAGTKAELLIMMQNQKFATAIDDGLIAARAVEQAGGGVIETILALVRPVVACIREGAKNGRTYLNELVFGDPSEPHRAEGIALASRLQHEMTRILALEPGVDDLVATALAKVVTAIIHVATTTPLPEQDEASAALKRIRQQMEAVVWGGPGCYDCVRVTSPVTSCPAAGGWCRL